MDKKSSCELGNTGLTVANVSFKYQSENNGSTLILDDICFHAEPGEFVCIVGPSGCGKTTLLNICAGFLIPSLGVIKVNERTVCCPHPSRAMVFQQDSLFPWLTVKDNVLFGPRCLNDANANPNYYIDLVGLNGYEDYYPYQLSGGMKQRAALARVLINKPDIMFLDEPFGALDAQSREDMQDVLQRVCQETKTMSLLVTHDVDEAIFLADRVVVMGTKPSSIVDDIRIDHPRPRPWEFREQPETIEIKMKVRSLISNRTGTKTQQIAYIKS